jgi:glycogen synthase
LIAIRYGSVPIVRATGGLNDTIREGYDGNGFRFHPYAVNYLTDAIGRALLAFRDSRGWALLRERGMAEDHSWAKSAESYVGLYQWALRCIGRFGVWGGGGGGGAAKHRVAMLRPYIRRSVILFVYSVIL